MDMVFSCITGVLTGGEIVKSKRILIRKYARYYNNESFVSLISVCCNIHLLFIPRGFLFVDVLCFLLPTHLLKSKVHFNTTIEHEISQ